MGLGGESIYKISEVAEMFKVGELTIRRLIKEGKLQAIRVGQQYRITPEAIEAFKRDNKS